MLVRKIVPWSIIAGLMLLLIFGGCGGGGGSVSGGSQPESLTISTQSLPDATISTSYAQTLSAGGGTSPYLWSVVSGNLPDGLTLDNSSGLITGTPVIENTYVFTVQVSDADNKTDDQQLSIITSSDDSSDILNISTTTLPEGTVGTSYSQMLSAENGASPYSWSVLSGNLPTGLILDNTSGLIAGTPVIENTYVFTVQVSDADNDTDDQQLSITTRSADSADNCNCDSLDTVVGQTTTVSSVSELSAAVNTINTGGGNHTILIEDGNYKLSSMLYLTSDNVVIRSLSGDRNNVVIEGQGMNGSVAHVFLIAGSNITIADISLGEVVNHGIQIQGEKGAGNLLVHNVRFFNTGEQMLKGTYGDTGPGSQSGIVECSLFEYTESFGPQYYIGGIDVHHGTNWVVRNNTFNNIRSPEQGDGSRTAEHAVHFWNNSANPTIENNTIINCDRGIGLGLGSSSCSGGLIRNNMIYGDNHGRKSDVGIGLETATNIKVYNNTIFFDHSYANAIEYRYPASTGNEIINNLTNKRILSRDGGATIVRNNITNAISSWFTNTSTGNLHLHGNIASVVDAGETLSEVETDIDCEDRTIDGQNDIGADEL